MTSASSQDQTYLSKALLQASCLYQTVRDFNPVLRKGFVLAEGLPSILKNSSVGQWAAGQQEVLVSCQTFALDKLQEKKTFYTSAFKSWLEADSIQEFIAHLEETYGTRWNASLSQLARQFYDQCSRIPGVEDTLYCVAFGMNEGSEMISKAMMTTWQELRELSSRKYLDLLKKKLGLYWNDSVRDRARVFYSIAALETGLKAQATQAKESVQDLMRVSKDVADQTSFVLLGTFDRMTFWALDSLDDYVLTYLLPPAAEEQNFKGSKRLMSMISRIQTEVSGLVKRQAEAVSSLSLVKKLESSLDVNSKAELMREGYKYITSITSQQLLEKTWPEDAKLLVDRVCDVMHISCVSSRFNVHVWAKLDQDSDGKVTVGDLYMSLQKAREVSPREALQQLWEKVKSAKPSSPVVVNGELSS
jgi:hypothetical protein